MVDDSDLEKSMPIPHCLEKILFQIISYTVRKW